MSSLKSPGHSQRIKIQAESFLSGNSPKGLPEKYHLFDLGKVAYLKPQKVSTAA